jgi:hypothetical protein
MPGQATLQLVLSTLYGGGAHTMHQTRRQSEIVQEIGDDGLPPDVIFGHVRFCDYNNKPVSILEASMTLDDPELHLIDFVVAGADPSLWRLRFWGGESGRAYRARVNVPNYASKIVSIAIDRAVSLQPLISNDLVGIVDGVTYDVVGIIGAEIVHVDGMVGV